MWKKTLFCWRGDLLLTPVEKAEEKKQEDGLFGHDNGKKEDGNNEVLDKCKLKLTWKGTWVGSSSQLLPSDKEFDSSQNKFQLQATCDSDLALGQATVPKILSKLGVVSWTGTYLLDNGEGHEPFSDFSHRCIFLEREKAPKESG
mmetsp:Transcript_21736/g.43124  ORF Transcript_21736/g.43124 Transcript_21736/m.43124 type:complete len:145 (+) Transcript_21736:1-435(+)